MEGVGVIEFFLTRVTLVTKGVRPVGWKRLCIPDQGHLTITWRETIFHFPWRLWSSWMEAGHKRLPRAQVSSGRKTGRVTASLQADGDISRPTRRLHLTWQALQQDALSTSVQAPTWTTLFLKNPEELSYFSSSPTSTYLCDFSSRPLWGWEAAAVLTRAR